MPRDRGERVSLSTAGRSSATGTLKATRPDALAGRLELQSRALDKAEISRFERFIDDAIHSPTVGVERPRWRLLSACCSKCWTLWMPAMVASTNVLLHRLIMWINLQLNLTSVFLPLAIGASAAAFGLTALLGLFVSLVAAYMLGPCALLPVLARSRSSS